MFTYGSCSCVDSDNEEDRSRSSYNGKSGKEFKDEEETVTTTKSVHIVQATETTATRKRGVPSKKVDLGAAAHYTGDKSPDTTPKQVEIKHEHFREDPIICVLFCSDSVLIFSFLLYSPSQQLRSLQALALLTYSWWTQHQPSQLPLV